jgi:4-hydroxybenzoate polyprenyltransferase
MEAQRQDLSYKLLYTLRTLWLFTYSDLKTMVFPSTAFALFTNTANLLYQPDDNFRPKLALMLWRIPLMLSWAWVNLLAFNVNNQKLSHAIKEDECNKPWRPLPAHRLTQKQASVLAIAVYLITLLASAIAGGGTVPALLLIVFGYAYNDLRAGDRSLFFRNVLNAFGFTSFAVGALEIAQGFSIELQTLKWVGIIGLVVSTTVHIQDLQDQIGDRTTGRLTIPVLLGDTLARYTVLVPVILWSYLCPRYWRLSSLGYVALGTIGATIAVRLFLFRTVKDDKATFVLYNVWLVSIYTLPLVYHAE